MKGQWWLRPYFEGGWVGIEGVGPVNYREKNSPPAAVFDHPGITTLMQNEETNGTGEYFQWSILEPYHQINVHLHQTSETGPNKEIWKKTHGFFMPFFLRSIVPCMPLPSLKSPNLGDSKSQKRGPFVNDSTEPNVRFWEFWAKKSGENSCWLCIFETCLMSALVSKHHWIAIRRKLGTRCQAALRLARRTCWWISFGSLWNPLFR